MVHEGSVREDSKLLAVSENPNPSAGKFLFHQLDDETDSNLFASLLRFLSAAVVVAADVVVAAPPVVVAAAVVVAGAAVVAAPPVVVAALVVVAAAADVAGAAALGFRNYPSASVDKAVPGSFVARNHADPSGQNPTRKPDLLSPKGVSESFWAKIHSFPFFSLLG